MNHDELHDAAKCVLARQLKAMASWAGTVTAAEWADREPGLAFALEQACVAGLRDYLSGEVPTKPNWRAPPKGVLGQE